MANRLLTPEIVRRITLARLPDDAQVAAQHDFPCGDVVVKIRVGGHDGSFTVMNEALEWTADKLAEVIRPHIDTILFASWQKGLST